MCDECDSVWLNPTEVDADHAIYPSPPEYLVSTKCSLLWSQWATRDEVVKVKWDTYIAGESQALDET